MATAGTIVAITMLPSPAPPPPKPLGALLALKGVAGPAEHPVSPRITAAMGSAAVRDELCGVRRIDDEASPATTTVVVRSLADAHLPDDELQRPSRGRGAMLLPACKYRGAHIKRRNSFRSISPVVPEPISASRRRISASHADSVSAHPANGNRKIQLGPGSPSGEVRKDDLSGFDLGQQIGVTIKDPQQFHQRQGWLGLAVLVS